MPSGIATAAIVGGSAIAGGLIASSAADDAAETQADAAREAAKTSTDTQLKMFYESRADTAPWREAGENALKTLVQKINAGPGTYTESPGYKFRLGEGLKAIDRSAAARGGLLSGRAVKEGTRFAEDYATGDYQNWLANYYASLTPYQSLAGVGQTTAAQNAAMGNQVGANVANTQFQGGVATGNALATGEINQANAITGGINSGLNNFMMWRYLNKTPSIPSAPYTPNPGYVGLDYGN